MQRRALRTSQYAAATAVTRDVATGMVVGERSVGCLLLPALSVARRLGFHSSERMSVEYIAVTASRHAATVNF